MTNRRAPARLPREEAPRANLKRKLFKASCAAKKHRRTPANGSQALALVDHFQWSAEEGKITLPVKREGFKMYDCDVVHALGRKSAKKDTYWKMGIYSGNELCLRTVSDPIPALNKASRVFGNISRNKHFRFALRCITVCGVSPRQFKSLVRIRDLYTRGLRRQFKKHILNYVFCFPAEVREAASSLAFA